MKKGYVISLVVIGLLIILSVGLLMKDLTNRNLSDNLKPTETTTVDKKEKEEEKPVETTVEPAPTEIAQRDAQAPKNTNITITNKQSGGDIANYSYQIKISGVSGAMLTVKNNEREYLVFDARGNASFNLLSNESITIVDVPVNATYTITQEKKDGYKVLVNGTETSTTSGTINEENTVTFANNVTSTAKAPTAPVPKEVESDVKNPVTSDKGMIAVTISLIALFTLILLKALKLDRYEEL